MQVSKELFEAVMDWTIDDVFDSRDDIIVFDVVDTDDYTHMSYNDFFFKCIDFMKDNDIDYYLDINNDIRNEVFEFLDKWILENQDELCSK